MHSNKCLPVMPELPGVCSGARHLELYADEVVEKPNKNLLRSLFWEGDTQGDAFLTAAAAQVKMEKQHQCRARPHRTVHT